MSINEFNLPIEIKINKNKKNNPYYYIFYKFISFIGALLFVFAFAVVPIFNAIKVISKNIEEERYGEPGYRKLSSLYIEKNFPLNKKTNDILLFFFKTGDNGKRKLKLTGRDFIDERYIYQPKNPIYSGFFSKGNIDKKGLTNFLMNSSASIKQFYDLFQDAEAINILDFLSDQENYSLESFFKRYVKIDNNKAEYRVFEIDFNRIKNDKTKILDRNNKVEYQTLLQLFSQKNISTMNIEFKDKGDINRVVNTHDILNFFYKINHDICLYGIQGELNDFIKDKFSEFFNDFQLKEKNYKVTYSLNTNHLSQIENQRKETPQISKNYRIFLLDIGVLNDNTRTLSFFVSNKDVDPEITEESYNNLINYLSSYFGQYYIFNKTRTNLLKYSVDSLKYLPVSESRLTVPIKKGLNSDVNEVINQILLIDIGDARVINGKIYYHDPLLVSFQDKDNTNIDTINFLRNIFEGKLIMGKANKKHFNNMIFESYISRHKSVEYLRSVGSPLEEK